MRKLLSSVLLIGLLAGCGQMGPLYLPGTKPPIKVAAPPKVEKADTELKMDLETKLNSTTQLLT